MSKSTSYKNYYELLNIQKSATKEEIKAAYKSIALVYHPDSNFFDEILGGLNKSHRQNTAGEYAEYFKLLTAAYHTLSNPEARAKYDETLPPDFPNWNSQLGAEGKKNNTPVNKNTVSGAFGVFGRMHEFDEDEFDSRAGNVQIKPVLAQNKSILGRIKSLLLG